ncbi:hypothetical protein Bbelb_090160 [Branchiostoma belcheri]|nr:hypothetical protein Bbelb_090160 [Branchiostoma belcheri]
MVGRPRKTATPLLVNFSVSYKTSTLLLVGVPAAAGPGKHRTGDICVALSSGDQVNIEYNTGYSVSPEVSARPRVGSPDGRRPEGDPTRGRAGTEGDAEYTVLYFIYVIPTQENTPFNAR